MAWSVQMAPLLAADVGDIIAVVVGVGILAYRLIVAVAQQRPQVRNPPPAPPQRPQPAKTPAEEVEEFLRRANARRGAPQAPAQPAAPARLPQAQVKVRRVNIPPKDRPVRADVVERPPLLPAGEAPLEGPSGRDVARHVEQHLDESGFVRQVENIAHLSSGQPAAVAEHVQEAFQHHIGSLAEALPDSTAAVASNLGASAASSSMSIAVTIGAILRNPDNIRTALVLGEVLHRPEERW